MFAVIKSLHLTPVGIKIVLVSLQETTIFHGGILEQTMCTFLC